MAKRSGKRVEKGKAVGKVLTVVIPALNEQDTIRPIVDRIIRVTSGIRSLRRTEIIVIDDHSSDATFEIVREMGKTNSKVACLRLSRRSGSFNAIRAGIAWCSGDAVVCLSADGQDPPELLPEMVARWIGGSQVVWATRRSRETEPLRVRFFAQAFYRVLKLVSDSVDRRVDLSRADFFLIDRKVADAVNSCSERNTSLFGLLAWMGFHQEEIEYDRPERTVGTSRWNFRMRFRFASDWIVAFSGLPLRLMTWLGGLVAFGGLLLMGFVLYVAFTEDVQGWASIMSVVVTLGGCQMIMLGIIGEYLWRNLDEARNRPNYFIERTSRE